MVTHDTIDGINRHRQTGRMPVGQSNKNYRRLVTALIIAILYMLVR